MMACVRAISVLIDACFAVHARLFVLLTCLVAVGMAAAAHSHAGWLWVTVGSGIAIGAWRRSWLAGCILSGAPFLAFVYVQWRLAVFQRGDIANLSHLPKVVFAGRITRIDYVPSVGKVLGADRLEVAVTRLIYPDGQAYQGVVLVQAPAGELSPGAQVVVRGKLQRPSPAKHPWEFDYAAYLRRRGILTLLRARSRHAVKLLPDKWRDTGSTSILLDDLYLFNSQIDRLRAGIIASHQRTLGRETGDLLSSIVIGNRAAKPPDKLVEDFRNVGLSHLLAASGFNLTIASGALFWLSSKLCRCDLTVNLISFAGIVAFVLLAGASPSVTRAALMCTLVLVLRALYRTPYPLAIISCALVATLAIDPLAVCDVGLQLSYCAAAGIVLLSGKMADGFSRLRCPRTLADCLSVIIAAQVSVLPVLLACFWQVGTMFLLSNLIVAPLVAPITIVGFLSSLTACLEPLHPWWCNITWVLDFIVKWPLQFLVWVAQYFAANKAAKLVIGPPLTIAIVIYYAVLLLLVLALYARRGRLLTSATFVAAAAALFWRPPLSPLMVARVGGCPVAITAERRACVTGRKSPLVVRYLNYHGIDAAQAALIPRRSEPARESP